MDGDDEGLGEASDSQKTLSSRGKPSPRATLRGQVPSGAASSKPSVQEAKTRVYSKSPGRSAAANSDDDEDAGTESQAAPDEAAAEGQQIQQMPPPRKRARSLLATGQGLLDDIKRDLSAQRQWASRMRKRDFDNLVARSRKAARSLSTMMGRDDMLDASEKLTRELELVTERRNSMHLIMTDPEALLRQAATDAEVDAFDSCDTPLAATMLQHMGLSMVQKDVPNVPAILSLAMNKQVAGKMNANWVAKRKDGGAQAAATVQKYIVQLCVDKMALDFPQEQLIRVANQCVESLGFCFIDKETTKGEASCIDELDEMQPWTLRAYHDLNHLFISAKILEVGEKSIVGAFRNKVSIAYANKAHCTTRVRSLGDARGRGLNNLYAAWSIVEAKWPGGPAKRKDLSDVAKSLVEKMGTQVLPPLEEAVTSADAQENASTARALIYDAVVETFVNEHDGSIRSFASTVFLCEVGDLDEATTAASVDIGGRFLNVMLKVFETVLVPKDFFLSDAKRVMAANTFPDAQVSRSISSIECELNLLRILRSFFTECPVLDVATSWCELVLAVGDVHQGTTRKQATEVLREWCAIWVRAVTELQPLQEAARSYTNRGWGPCKAPQQEAICEAMKKFIIVFCDISFKDPVVAYTKDLATWTGAEELEKIAIVGGELAGVLPEESGFIVTSIKAGLQVLSLHTRMKKEGKSVGIMELTRALTAADRASDIIKGWPEFGSKIISLKTDWENKFKSFKAALDPAQTEGYLKQMDDGFNEAIAKWAFKPKFAFLAKQEEAREAEMKKMEAYVTGYEAAYNQVNALGHDLQSMQWVPCGVASDIQGIRTEDKLRRKICDRVACHLASGCVVSIVLMTADPEKQAKRMGKARDYIKNVLKVDFSSLPAKVQEFLTAGKQTATQSKSEAPKATPEEGQATSESKGSGQNQSRKRKLLKRVSSE